VSADVYYTYIKSNEERCILISTRCCTYGQHGVVVCYLSLIQTDINSAQYFVSLLHPYSTYLYYYIAYCLLPYILHVAYCPSTLVMNRICQACKKTQLCFPCRVCSQECSYSVTGECWLHQHCIRMSLTAYVECSQKPLQIFCLHCACDGHYNFHASLKRIACLAPDTNHMRDQAEAKNR